MNQVGAFGLSATRPSVMCATQHAPTPANRLLDSAVVPTDDSRAHVTRSFNRPTKSSIRLHSAFIRAAASAVVASVGHPFVAGA